MINGITGKEILNCYVCLKALPRNPEDTELCKAFDKVTEYIYSFISPELNQD